MCLNLNLLELLPRKCKLLVMQFGKGSPGGTQGTLRRSDALFQKSGLHSPCLGESLQKVNLTCCQSSQLLYGVHGAITTETEGERRFNVSENTVFFQSCTSLPAPSSLPLSS